MKCCDCIESLLGVINNAKSDCFHDKDVYLVRTNNIGRLEGDKVTILDTFLDYASEIRWRYPLKSNNKDLSRDGRRFIIDSEKGVAGYYIRARSDTIELYKVKEGYGDYNISDASVWLKSLEEKGLVPGLKLTIAYELISPEVSNKNDELVKCILKELNHEGRFW